MSEDAVPIILLPGLGMDERLFAMQKLEFSTIQVPEWLPHRTFESLADYGRRMAEAVDPGKPCYVGGMSFGGMVALEMARHLDCRGCFLISSVRSFQDFPDWARFLGPWSYILPPRSDLLLAGFSSAALWTFGRLLPPAPRQFLSNVSKLRAPIMPWACRAVYSWKPAQPLPGPIFQIHGATDKMLPAQRSHAEEFVPQGGHYLPLLQPFVINDFLRRKITGQERSLSHKDIELQSPPRR
ncbi:MAG: alpha/beta fold hydrolase [Planctomycetaceae bacterium]